MLLPLFTFLNRISNRLQKATEDSLTFREILRFKNKMTPDQIKKLIDKGIDTFEEYGGYPDKPTIHDILNLMDEMTPEQIERFQRRIFSHGSNKDAAWLYVRLYEHDVKIIPEIKVQAAIGIIQEHSVDILKVPHFEDVLGVKDRHEWTPIHQLGAEGITEILNPKYRNLLKIKDAEEETPFHRLANSPVESYVDASEVMNKILKPEFRDFFSMQDVHGYTPLHYLIYSTLDVKKSGAKTWRKIITPDGELKSGYEFLENSINIENTFGESPLDNLIKYKIVDKPR